MNGEDGFHLIFYALALILPLSALAARRLSWRKTGGMFLLWLVIIGLAAVAANLGREGLGGGWSRFLKAARGDTQEVSGGTVRIAMAPDGHFWALVDINGVSRRMLIDSGATSTALSVATAEAAGIARDESGPPVVLQTANGRVAAETATIDRLTIGPITARNLRVVVSPAFGRTDIIGMNFLSQLASWRVEGRTLILDAPSAD